jgi:GNAT superfamily N-acetyltransferase
MKKNVDEQSYKIVDINEENIDKQGLFCLQSKKNTEGYKKKVEWAKERFKEGLRIKLLLINEGPKRGFRSRGFIEYIPGEYAWRGIDAKGYIVVHCIWVVGKNKGHGYGSKLLEHCLNDAKGMYGVAVVTSGRTWLPGAKLFIKHGFEKVNSLPPDFELLAKRFSDNAPLPKFNRVPKGKLEKYAHGITVFKSNQCPYVSGSVREITETAKHINLPLQIKDIKNCKEAQNGVHPYGTFCILLDGKVLTYRPIGEKGLLNSLKSQPPVD